MRVYVAGRFSMKEEISKAISKVREAGHTITLDWTFADDVEVPVEHLRGYHACCATMDAHAVVMADVLILYPHETGKGLYTELGVALALHKRIYVVGEYKPYTVFLAHPACHWMPTIEAVLKDIAQPLCGDLLRAPRYKP